MFHRVILTLIANALYNILVYFIANAWFRIIYITSI